MSKNIVSASLVIAALALWLGSGKLWGDSAPMAVSQHDSIENTGYSESQRATSLDKVRVARMTAQTRDRTLTLRGRTESKRTVKVKAEVAGQIVSRPVERGMRVEQGDLLCEIAVDDRKVTLQEARAAFDTAQIEFQGSLKLKDQGLLSDVSIAKADANREAARAHLHRQELNLARTRITAPFSGVVEELQMNTGDYAVPGAPCATLIDLDPMLVVAHVTEGEVDKVKVRQSVSGDTVNGQTIEGLVSFVAQQSDPETRTYPVEITVPNRDYQIRSGLSVTLALNVEKVLAHPVTPSLLSLSDEGTVGLRVLDAANRVIFKPVTILEDGAQGMWVTGLPETVKIITVGQEYVALGDVVEPVFSETIEDQIASR
ncbi:MAG: efflux RND transporter periplasmic adaptor subunit [Halioglobus sp.]